MSIPDLHVGDIGTVLRFIVKENGAPLDISEATLLMLCLQKKDKSVIDRPLVFTTDGTDGQVEYVTVYGDIDQKGTWKAQVFYGSTSGSWHTTIVDLDVDDNVCVR